MKPDGSMCCGPTAFRSSQHNAEVSTSQQRQLSFERTFKLELNILILLPCAGIFMIFFRTLWMHWGMINL